MFGNQVQQMFLEVHNQQAAMGGQPDINSRIQLPGSVQVGDEQLFTNLYWTARWTLEQGVQQDPILNVVWNKMSQNNFQNNEFAKLVSVMETNFNSLNGNADPEANVVIPILYMSAAGDWLKYPQLAEQVMDQNKWNELQGWAQAKQRLNGPNTGGGFGGGRSNTFGTFTGNNNTNGFGRQAAGFGRQVQGGMNANNNNKSGLFSTFVDGNTGKPQVAGGARDTFTPASTVVGVETPSTKTESAQPFGARSNTFTQVEKAINPLDEDVPTEEFDADQLLGQDAMTPQAFPCVSQPMAKPQPTMESATMTKPGQKESATLLKASVLNGELLRVNEFEHGGFKLNANEHNLPRSEKNKMVADAKKYDILDHVMAEGDTGIKLVTYQSAKTPEEQEQMDWSKHVLGNGLPTPERKYDINYATFSRRVDLTNDGDDGAMKTELEVLRKEATLAKLTTDADTLFEAAKVEADEVEMAVEVVGTEYKAFKVASDSPDFETLEAMAKLGHQHVGKYVELMGTLSRSIQIFVQAKFMDAVNSTFRKRFFSEATIEELADVTEAHDFIAEKYPEDVEIAVRWANNLTEIMRTTVAQLAPHEPKEAERKGLPTSDEDGKDVIIFSKVITGVYLPVTLEELRLTKSSDAGMFYLSVGTTGVYDMLSNLRKRYMTVNPGGFDVALADGYRYHVTSNCVLANTFNLERV